MKRLVTLLIVMTMLLGVFAGCGQAKDPVVSDTTEVKETTATVETETTKLDPVDLKVWVAKQEIIEPFQEMLDKYKESNPHVTITSERPGGDQYYTTIKVLFASGDTPDVFALGVGALLKEYDKNGLLVDLSAENYDVFDTAKKACTVDGKLVALPMDIAGIGVIYNKKVFKDAGISEVPKTVTQLKEACDKIKAKNLIPFSVAFKDAWTLRQLFAAGHTPTVELDQFVMDMNAGKTSFKNDKMGKAFETFDMISTNCNEKPLDSDYNNLCTLFAQGKAGMMVQGLWALSNVTKIAPDTETGMFALPVSENADDARMMGDVDSTFCLYSKSKNIEESKKFMKWLTTKDATDMWTQKCNLISAVKGTSAPTSIGAAADDLLQYFTDNKVVRWGFREWPTGYDMELAKIFQSYYAKAIDRDEFYTTIDKLWQDTIKK